MHLEIRKFWYKYALSRSDSHMYTRTAMLSTWRHTGSQNSRGHSNIDTQSDISLNDSVVRGKNGAVKTPKIKMVPNVRIRFQSSDTRNSRSSSNSSPTMDPDSRYVKLQEAYITRTWEWRITLTFGFVILRTAIIVIREKKQYIIFLNIENFRIFVIIITYILNHTYIYWTRVPHWLLYFKSRIYWSCD